jgi:hypothetical protein
MKTHSKIFKEKWANGISKIYQDFYKKTKKVKGCEFEIIDSEKFCKSYFEFHDPTQVDFANGKFGYITF